MRHGLREAHVHLAMLGRALSLLDVSGVRSRDELVEVLCGEHARLAPGKWLIATGLRVESWANPSWPTLQDLDRATPERAVVVRGFDYHSLAASSAALRLAGVCSTQADPESGVFCRDEQGQLTGVCLESAARVVWSAVPDPDEHERLADVRKAIVHLRGLGFVEAHDLLSPPWLGPLLAKLADAGELPLAMRLFPLVTDLAEVAAGAKSWRRGGLELGGGKIFADGTLNARTAWMLEPYVGGMAGHRCGVPNWNHAQLCDAVRVCEGLGLGLATHAIGDGAVRAVLDAIEEAGSGRVRHRVEHCEVIDAADVPRFSQLGVIASVQPCHLLYDIEVLRRSLPHRLERVLPLRELLDSGCVAGELLIFGSDAPIVRADPNDSLQAATARRRAGMPEQEAIGIAQAISAAEAWSCFSSRS